MQERIIKATNKGICPHCSKPILISTRAYAPHVDWVLKEEDIERAKSNLKKEIAKLKFKDEDRKRELIEWLNNKEVMIGLEEVQPMLAQIIKDNIKKEDADDK